MKTLSKTMLLVLAVSTLTFFSCNDDDDENNSMPEAMYSDVMAGQVKTDLVDDASISPYAAIFDVSPVYNEGHLPFATNAGGLDGLADKIGALDKNQMYLVYCHGDAPSIAGAELMAENGFTKVYRLQGNYAAWDAVSFVDISAAKVKEKMDAGDFKAIFDVSPVWDQGHLPGAINANASAGGTDLAELIAGMDKTKSYLVYCHGNAPAMAGAQLMEDAGFTNVFRLEGNFGAWVDAGYDVETPAENTYTDIMADQVKMQLVDDASISPYAAIFDVSPVYANGHLPFSTDAGGLDGLADKIGALDKNQMYLVYCHGDAPSMAGAQLMADNGFMNVYRLEGNYGAYDALSFVDISAAKVKEKMDAGAFEAIFDVSPYFNTNHIPGATNANSSGGGTDLASLINGMDKTKTYLVYCHANGPAMAGAQLMEDAGFTNVFRLEGNFSAWIDAGYAVEN